jgi:hypothetical protein
MAIARTTVINPVGSLVSEVKRVVYNQQASSLLPSPRRGRPDNELQDSYWTIQVYCREISLG